MTTQNLPDDIRGFECFEDTKADELERLYSFISNHLFRYFQRVKDNEFLNKEITDMLKKSRFFTLLWANGSSKSSLLFETKVSCHKLNCNRLKLDFLDFKETYH